MYMSFQEKIVFILFNLYAKIPVQSDNSEKDKWTNLW